MSLLFVFLALLIYGSPRLRPQGFGLPPVERIEITRIVLPQPGLIVLTAVNTGPEPVTIAQVRVDEAYWRYEIQPTATISRLRSAAIRIPYPWVEGERHEISLVTATGASFSAEIPVATQTPVADHRSLLQLALIGFYVGVIPVGLGLLWHPFMRDLSRTKTDAVLSLTIGLLIFLCVETTEDGLEIAARLPDAFSGQALFTAGALFAYLLIQRIGLRRAFGPSEAAGRLRVSYLLAFGIGLHNLAEGLAIGAAYGAGQVALGAFLIVGFTLHNITEGIGIAAPVAHDRPGFFAFLWLTLIGGAPAIAGAWIGGFVYSDLAAALFLGIGLGAIVQVIAQVARLLLSHSSRYGMVIAAWPNLVGLALGLGLMYGTSMLVAV